VGLEAGHHLYGSSLDLLQDLLVGFKPWGPCRDGKFNVGSHILDVEANEDMPVKSA